MSSKGTGWTPKPHQIESNHGVYFTEDDVAGSGVTTSTVKVHFTSWKRRENWRLGHRINTGLFWFDDGKHLMSRREDYTLRYPHVSKTRDKFISYTENDEKGNRDIQTTVPVGRYLSRFHPDLHPADVKALVDEFNAYYDDNTPVQFTDDPEVIAQIYQNGPESCMSCSPDYFTESFESPFGDIHPSQVYGKPNSDLSLAYLGTVDSPIARAVVDQNKKYFVRGYGQVERLTNLLKNQGYEHRNQYDQNTKLNLHTVSDRRGYLNVLCPYIDTSGDTPRVTVKDDTLVFDKDGICAQETRGYINYRIPIQCSHCGVSIHHGNEFIVDDCAMCRSCRDRLYTICALTGTYVPNNDPDNPIVRYITRYGDYANASLRNIQARSAYYGTICSYHLDALNETVYLHYHQVSLLNTNRGPISVATRKLRQAQHFYRDIINNPAPDVSTTVDTPITSTVTEEYISSDPVQNYVTSREGRQFAEYLTNNLQELSINPFIPTSSWNNPRQLDIWNNVRFGTVEDQQDAA
jgi:hypothetical protein